MQIESGYKLANQGLALLQLFLAGKDIRVLIHRVCAAANAAAAKMALALF